MEMASRYLEQQPRDRLTMATKIQKHGGWLRVMKEGIDATPFGNPTAMVAEKDATFAHAALYAECTLHDDTGGHELQTNTQRATVAPRLSNGA